MARAILLGNYELNFEQETIFSKWVIQRLKMEDKELNGVGLLKEKGEEVIQLLDEVKLSQGRVSLRTLGLVYDGNGKYHFVYNSFKTLIDSPKFSLKSKNEAEVLSVS